MVAGRVRRGTAARGMVLAILPRMSKPTLRLLLGRRIHELAGVAPDRTLLDVLRDDLYCTAVKEGCASGDCGACTVALAERGDDGRLHWRAINSCIRLAHSVQGMAVFTAEDIAGADGTLHPAQRAMVECHGSQCGFCTPGFVMSLFVLHRQPGGGHVAPTLPAARGSLPPEGAGPALGRPGGGAFAPTLAADAAALPPEGAGPALGRPGGWAAVPTLAAGAAVLLPEGAEARLS